jgi:hypothetical protein
MVTRKFGEFWTTLWILPWSYILWTYYIFQICVLGKGLHKNLLKIFFFAFLLFRLASNSWAMRPNCLNLSSSWDNKCAVYCLIFFKEFAKTSWAPVVHACTPSYSGVRDQEDCSLKPAWANSCWDPILKKDNTKKGLVGVVQKVGLEFKP